MNDSSHRLMAAVAGSRPIKTAIFTVALLILLWATISPLPYSVGNAIGQILGALVIVSIGQWIHSQTAEK